MTTQEVVLGENHRVTKSNRLIEARYKLTRNEQRFVLIMTSLIEPSQGRFTFYRVPVKSLIRWMGLENNHRAYERIREVVDSLLKKPLEIRTEKELIKANWVSSVSEYVEEKGIVTFEFSEKLKPYLLQLKEQFSSYRLEHVLKLKSAYSIRFYELLKQYERVGHRTIQLDDLRRMLHVDSRYPEYADLRKNVIDPAQRELRASTDIAFEYQPVRQHRRIVALEFKIVAPSPARELRQPERLPEANARAVETLVAAGLRRSDAKEIAAKGWLIVTPAYRADAQARHDSFESYVEEKAQAYARGRSKGRIRAATGWLVAALRKDYQVEPVKKKRAGESEPTSTALAERKQREEWKTRRFEELIEARPECLEQAVAALAERPFLQAYWRPDRSASENARRGARPLRLFLRDQLERQLPEEFAETRTKK